jgi:alginate O-acetyltransferase complex protein AlgJ
MTPAEHLPPAIRRIRRARAAVITVLVCVGLWLPLLDWVVPLDPSPVLEERRELAPPPAPPASWREVLAWPAAFEKFYNDHFGFRRFLIRGFGTIKVFVLHSSPFEATGESRLIEDAPRGETDLERMYPPVVLGRDGWMFYGEYMMADFRGLVGMQYPEMLHWEKHLEDRQDWCRRRGIAYLFVAVPDKQTIYPDFVPQHISHYRDRTRLDRLMAHLARRPDLNILDLRPALAQARKHHDVYSKTDTHWNDRGCMVAYNAIMDRLDTLLPGVRRLGPDDFIETRAVTDGGNLALLCAIPDLLREEGTALWPRVWERVQMTNDALKPERARQPVASVYPDGADAGVVIFRDSFTTPLIKFFSATFRRVAYYHFTEFDTAIIESEKPRLVMDIISEATISRGAPPNPEDVVTTGAASWSAGRETLSQRDTLRFRAAHDRFRAAHPER